MLVEIILGKKTGDAALALALDFVRAIRKTPIVVNDARGFYTSRVVGTYIREGHLMLAEGVPAAMIENVGRMAGMPVGPLALNDEVAVDLAWKIVKATDGRSRPFGRSIRGQKALLEFMVEKQGRLGRKNGKGFYDYPEKGPKKLWPGLAEIQPKKLDPDKIDVAGDQGPLAGDAGAGDRALLRGGRAHRCARGRRRLDPRLWLCAVLRRHAVLHRHDGREDVRRALPAAWRRNTARALRRRSCCSTWRRRTKAFMGASRPERRRPDHASLKTHSVASTRPRRPFAAIAPGCTLADAGHRWRRITRRSSPRRIVPTPTGKPTSAAIR